MRPAGLPPRLTVLPSMTASGRAVPRRARMTPFVSTMSTSETVRTFDCFGAAATMSRATLVRMSRRISASFMRKCIGPKPSRAQLALVFGDVARGHHAVVELRHRPGPARLGRDLVHALRGGDVV